ncbi:putative sporulation-specific glycosylase YdhD [Desulfosporosinus acididurans]|uniref:Putative sporulation-specific glycosylase YdhD n=1 Tax=Desulfosporosinus acididurans TaxID=476652 RepID=A0A0J1FSU6_9FIRM|nr:glycosyl hydrolase family 18 protein [Desulfosporosinus acididurans]KLU66382.1 putative sporulation-specific glycosylase YdhD [Desulfosporosinus acididurans]
MYKINKRLLFLSTTVVLCILMAAVFFITNSKNTSPKRSRSINGWIPYWNQATAITSVKNNPEVFNEISPFWYDASKNGDIKPLNNSEDPQIINYAQNKKLILTPLISNEFSSSLISAIVNDPVLMQNHIQNIVNIVISQNYSGIDLDYENVLPSDKKAFTLFVQKLANALHEKNKLLYVTLTSKTTATEHPGQDYKAIGEAADKVRIMAYDYSWSTSSPGPIAPVNWVNNVISYAISVINPNKIELGIPDYGYNWSGSKGIGINYLHAVNTAARYNSKVTIDPNSGPHYTYSDKKGDHTVWFENESSIQPLLDLVNKYNLNGISIWSLGGEDPKIYTAINTKFPSVVEIARLNK